MNEEQQEKLQKELEEAPFGRYPNGTPISEHPSPQEIEDQYEYYTEIAKQEDLELVETLKDANLGSHFMKLAPKADREACVEMALSWWAEYWPEEVSIFFDEVNLVKQNLTNRGYSNDKDKAQRIRGKIPARVLGLLRLLDREFWYTNEGYDTIYKVFKKGLICD